ncbi:MAG: recombinase family protein [Acetobacteraceae bacterium]|nr:MAG: recombinase family protein [Acetobacteraceae bacterium]
MTCAVAYFRTSSQTNVDGDSVPRQRAACAAHAARAGLSIRHEFTDAAVKGADRIDARTGFQAMLAWCAEHDCKTIIVENASRFARDLIVQETGFQMLTAAGYTLVAADDPDAFTASTPTQDLIRQVLGAVAQFEKANLVAKLKAARDRKSAQLGRRIEGPLKDAAQVAAARRLAPDRSLREVAEAMAEEGFRTTTGTILSAAHVSRLLKDTRLASCAAPA